MRSFKESSESEEEEEWKQKKNLMDFLVSLFPLKQIPLPLIVLLIIPPSLL